jgi:hypothetical protein
MGARAAACNQLHDAVLAYDAALAGQQTDDRRSLPPPGRLGAPDGVPTPRWQIERWIRCGAP